MFKLLSQMITQANLSGMTLMIRPTGQGRLSVVICAESTDWKADDPTLKAALTQPLAIEGEVLGLEEKLMADLTNHSESFVRAVLSSNANEVSAAHDAQTQMAKAKSDDKGADKTEVDDTATAQEDAVSDKPAVVGEEATDPDLF